MKVIVAGSRDIDDWAIVHRAIGASGFKFSEMVTGGARGVDTNAESLAQLHGMPSKVFQADWVTYGKRAGSIRNAKMAAYADALIAIPGAGPGTWNMIDQMKALGKPVYIHQEKPSDDEQ